MKIFKRLAPYLFSICFSLFLLETGVRVYDWSIKKDKPISQKAITNMLIPYGIDNFFNAPDFQWTNGNFIIKTNQYGMHWFDCNKKKKKGVKRIGFYGDSFTFGCWATNYEKSFVGVTNEKLKSDSIEI